MEIWQEVESLARSLTNDPVRNARAAGKPVVGFLCSYVPEEIIEAAGCVPYRIRAAESTGSTLGDSYYGAVNCSFIRRTMDLVLRGGFSFLSGVIFLNGCDHSRRLYDNWRDAARSAPEGPGLLHMLVAPHRVAEDALPRYEEELQKLVLVLSEAFNTRITDQDFSRAIKLSNQKRALAFEISALRRQVPAPLTGAQMLSLSLAASALPLADAVSLLSRVREALSSSAPAPEGPPPARIFVSGGCMEDFEHLALIESAGAIAVADNLCMGTRSFSDPVSETDPPMQAIARRYLTHLSCPRMIDDFGRRAGYVEEQMAEAEAEALIICKLKFCDLWGGEAFLLRKRMRDREIPVLLLERELYGGGEGQTRTRVQAFLEQIQNLRRRKS
ncbi:MAG: 2-hydroxyacyl-CoA dehydratase family protein [Thermodesulfobacteriota bacterium]